MYNQISLINVREYRKGNQKWTIQRNWQHKVHKTKKLSTQGTQDEEKQNKNNPEKPGNTGYTRRRKTKTQHNVLDTTIDTNKHK